MINSGDYDIETTIESALEHFNSDYTWAEAVLLAVSKVTGRNDPCIPRIASGLAVGLGGMGEMCGAVSGGVLAIGLFYGEDQAVAPRTRGFVHQFAERAGNLRCVDLLGLEERSGGVLEHFNQDLKEQVCYGVMSTAVQVFMEQLKVWEEGKGDW